MSADFAPNNLITNLELEVNRENFDAEFYKHFYPDVGNLKPSALHEHWLSIGKKESRFPNDDEAVKYYVLTNDLPSSFDVDEYLFLNDDIRASFSWKYEAVLHYSEYGKQEDRQFNVSGEVGSKTQFDWPYYQLFNKDLAGLSKYELSDHWLRYGLGEGRSGNLPDYVIAQHGKNILPEGFNVPTYINLNKDLVGQYADYRSYIKHYVDYGYHERRDFESAGVDSEFVRSYYKHECLSTNPGAVMASIRLAQSVDSFVPVFLSEAEMCNYFGFREEELLELFDHDAYVHLNSELTSHLDGCVRTECLEHFFTTGIRNSCDISFTDVFDHRFYACEYHKKLFADGIRFNFRQVEYTEVQVFTLYEHWIKTGLGQGLHSNFSSLAKKRVGKDLPEEIAVEIEKYRKIRNVDQFSEMPSESLAKYIDKGWENIPRAEPILKSSAGFLCGIAINLRVSGRRDEAVRLYEYILDDVPGYPEALHNLGDEYLNSGFYRSAIKCYRELVRTNAANEWTYLNCAGCYEKVGDWSSATEILKSARAKFPVDKTILEKERSISTKQFEVSYSNATKLALTGDLDGARKLLSTSLDQFDDHGEGEKVLRSTKQIAIIANLDLPQCRFYRVEQKVELFNKQGYSVLVYGHNENLSGFIADLENFEAVIFYRVPAFPPIIDAINATNVQGIPSIYDVDDLIFDDDVFPPPYSTYANQITKDQYNSMAIDTCLISNAMTRCTHGIASTENLADHMRNYVKSGEVFTLRNGFSSAHTVAMEKYKRKTDAGCVTIFYGSGTKAHKQEFHEIIEPAFKKLKAKHGENIRFIIVGSFEQTECLEELGDSVTVLEKIDSVDQYWALLAGCADINISILASSAVTDSKSEIKWLEAAMFGIPSVVSRTSAYEECTVDGEDVLLCDTPDEYFEKIDLLVSDKTVRHSIGEKARMSACTNYSVLGQSSSLVDIIRQVKGSSNEQINGTEKLKVAVVNVFYPPELIGGATRVVYDNVTAIRAMSGGEFELEVFCTQSGPKPYSVKKYLDNGVRVTAVTSPDGWDHQLSDTQMQRSFDIFLENFKPDIVHFHCIQRLTESVITATRKRDIPYLITAHDGWWVSDKQFLVGKDEHINLYDYEKDILDTLGSGASRQLILQAEIENASAVLAVSEPFAKVYESAGLKNVVCVENGVSNLSKVQKKPSANGKVRLAHIGGLERHKGLHLIRNALVSSPEIRNIELLVIDYAAKSGGYREEMWGSTVVKIIAKTHQNAVADLYSNIDVLMAPSVWPESFGLVTREALFCGCWVVASDRGAVGGDVIEGVNGHIVDVASSKGVAEVLKTVSSDTEKYLKPPGIETQLRSSYEQAEELCELYKIHHYCPANQ